MTDFTDAYADLLIKQYWEQSNAHAEISAQAATWEKIRDIYADFETAFDLDLAVGVQLDIIGKIVGLSRTVPLVIARIAFGFSDNPNARGFDDKFIPEINAAPFQDKSEPSYSSLELDDSAYRVFLTAKIAQNNGSAFMVSDDRITIQDVIQTGFKQQAWVVDKKDMHLILYVFPTVELEYLRTIQQLGLLPKPQAVRYDIVQAEPGATFGFSDNASALVFDDKFDTDYEGGVFANKVI